MKGTKLDHNMESFFALSLKRQMVPWRYVLDKDYLHSVLFYKSNFRVNTRPGSK